MSKVKIFSQPVPNMPWQERPEKLMGAPIWRYNENPIIGRNPVKGVARIFNSAVSHMAMNLSVYSVVNRQMVFHIFIWEEVRMPFIGILKRIRLTS